MLKELKFVQGAVAKKDFVPAMKHFEIENGVVRSFNGMVALSSPIPFDIDCKPQAVGLVRAITNCKDTVSLSITPTGRLRIVSGAFRTIIECVEGETPHVQPEGDFLPINGNEVLEAFEALEPFIGNDASRPWGTGILLSGQSAFATNNVMLAEHWMGIPFPRVVNIPHAAVNEILRINEVCIGLQMALNSITFHFADKKWVRTNLLAIDWPDVRSIMNKPNKMTPVSDVLFEALECLKPFSDKLGRVFIHNGKAYTHAAPDGSPSAEEGACYDIPDIGFSGIYRIEMLSLLKGVASQCDMSLYPQPCLFVGDKLRGAIIGMRG